MPSQDYEEFIAALNNHKVRFLIVGAHAVAYHAIPRATKDLDIFIEPTRTNVIKLIDAMRDFFGGADLGYTPEDILDPQGIIQLGVAPLRIDLFTELLGCQSFKIAWKNRVTAKFGSMKAYYIGLTELINAKEAAGRIQDMADLQNLKRGRRNSGKKSTSKK